MMDKSQQQAQEEANEELLHGKEHDIATPARAIRAVRILHFNHEKHRMEPSLHVRMVSDQNNKGEKEAEGSYLDEPVSDSQEASNVNPSAEWLSEYHAWNRFAEVDGPPTFSSLQELREFNSKGQELAERLEQELDIDQDHSPTDSTKTIVEPFKPLYSNVAVGDVVCAWWHVKDMNYGLVLPIQKLPISDDLKSRFQAWRFRKRTGWLDPDIRAELNMEGHDLEEDLLWELNVSFVGERDCSGSGVGIDGDICVGVSVDNGISAEVEAK